MSFETPILFLVFNRPAATAKVFAQIKKIRPLHLYIAADGPRKEIAGESAKCTEVRNAVLNSITWDCTVKTLFREQNLGCKQAVSSALNWFFENEEMGIVLEDDCLPDLSFFHFCRQLLQDYKDDASVMAINGCNFGFKSPNDYFFSRYFNAWGWATWKRAAIDIDYQISSWQDKNKFWFLWRTLRSKLDDFDLNWFRYWEGTLNGIAADKMDTWDFQWCYRQWETKRTTIVAGVNLVTNIGFNAEATHTTLQVHPAAKLPLQSMAFPLRNSASAKIELQYESKAVKPICYMHKVLPNSFYFKNWLLRFEPISRLNKLKKQLVRHV